MVHALLLGTYLYSRMPVIFQHQPEVMGALTQEFKRPRPVLPHLKPCSVHTLQEVDVMLALSSFLLCPNPLQFPPLPPSCQLCGWTSFYKSPLACPLCSADLLFSGFPVSSSSLSPAPPRVTMRTRKLLRKHAANPGATPEPDRR